MAQQKLYTEEQVRRLIDGYYDVNWTIHDAFDELEPIELPSDEDIAKQFTIWVDVKTEYSHKIEGAKWLRDKISGGNK